jgi:hypothetical protein
MSVKLRQAKERRPQFSDETLVLFRILEATPMGLRGTDEFKARDRELHRLLDLETDWRMAGNVLNRSEQCCYPMGMPAYGAFHHCRAVREALLEAGRDSRPLRV